MKFISICYLLFSFAGNSVLVHSQVNDSSLVNQLLLLSEEAQNNNTLRAVKYARQADSISTLLNYELGIIKSKKQMGNLFMIQNLLDKALAQYYLGLQVADKGNFKEESVKLLNNIGVAYQEKGALSKALDYHLQALDISGEIDYKTGVAASSNNIGIIHYKSNNIDKALEYFRYSLEMKEALNDTLGMKQSLNNIASIYLEKFDYDSALIMYNRCLILEQLRHDRTQISITQNNMGQLYLVRGEFEKAEILFNQALENAKAETNPMVLASIYDNMGQVNHYLKNYSQAIKYFDSCVLVAQKSGDYENERSAYLHFSELYSDIGNYQPAYNYYKKYESLSNRLIEESTRVNESEAIFIKQQKENEILRLERDQETKRLQISILISVLVFFTLLSLVIFVLFRQRQKTIYVKTLAEQQRLRFKAVLETQEQERKRIASDLHDSIGQLLSVIKLNMSDLEDTLPFNNSEQEKQFNDALKMVDEACNEARSISHNIMPSALIRSGIVPALRELVNRVNKSNKLKIEIAINDFPQRLDENIEIGLYRIIQEMVNNIIKHAKADQAQINLSRDEKNLTILVSDNGIGISKKEIEGSAGIGWKNIYSRLNAINAEIDIKRGKTKGSEMLICIPVIE